MADVLRVLRRWRGAYARWRYDWDGRVPGSLLPVALALGLVVGLWWGRATLGDATGAAPSTDPTPSSQVGDGRPAAHDLVVKGRESTRPPLDRCVVVHADQRSALEALGPPMAQWVVHMGAMNKLVAGAIDPPQLQEFWDGTRDRAATDLEALPEARRVLEQGGTGCPAPGSVTSERLRTCAAAVASRHRQLDRAVPVLETWRSHVRHMEMLRSRAMTVEEMTRWWEESWSEARRQVDAYRRVAQADAAEEPCGG